MEASPKHLYDLEKNRQSRKETTEVTPLFEEIPAEVLFADLEDKSKEKLGEIEMELSKWLHKRISPEQRAELLKEMDEIAFLIKEQNIEDALNETSSQESVDGAKKALERIETETQGIDITVFPKELRDKVLAKRKSLQDLINDDTKEAQEFVTPEKEALTVRSEPTQAEPVLGSAWQRVRNWMRGLKNQAEAVEKEWGTVPLLRSVAQEEGKDEAREKPTEEPAKHQAPNIILSSSPEEPSEPAKEIPPTEEPSAGNEEERAPNENATTDETLATAMDERLTVLQDRVIKLENKINKAKGGSKSNEEITKLEEKLADLNKQILEITGEKLSTHEKLKEIIRVAEAKLKANEKRRKEILEKLEAIKNS